MTPPATPDQFEPGARRLASPDWRQLGLVWLAGAVFGALTGFFFLSNWKDSTEPDVARYRAVRDFVHEHYVREVRPEVLLDQALHGMLEELDGYSRYYDRSQVAAIDRDTTGMFRGIGAVFKQPVDEGRVLFNLPGSPAERAGLRPGDRIESVDGRRVVEMARGELHALIANSPRDELEFQVIGLDRQPRTLRVGRAPIVDPTVRHARVVDAERGIAYLAIGSFSQETPDEFDQAIQRLKRQGMRALVLDLRGNLGGVLISAVHIANRFVRDGLLVSTEGRGDVVQYRAQRDVAVLLGLPLVLLVDQESASASEVLAAALQDHRAAVIVGSPTYGKGMVQKVKSFGNAEAEVKLTTAYYYTPSHRNIERTVRKAWDIGLAPDVTVEITEQTAAMIHAHLATYSPPADAEASLRAWEQAEGLSLIPSHPPDPQLDAALGLLRGERPGSHRLERRG